MSINELLNGYELLVPKKISEEETPYKLLKGAILTEDLKNIALTGSYGSGKSSVIKSIKNDKNIKNIKSLSISLLNFSHKYLKEGEEKTIELEKRILQQIFYQKTSEELPLTKFHKIKKTNFKAIETNIFYLLLYIIVGFVLKEKYSDILKGVIKTGKVETINILIWFLFGVYFMCSVYIFTNLLNGIYNLKLKKISSGKFLEVETEDEKDKSYLDLYMEDIIYCFEELNIKMLYIEDLDRCNDIDIFIKLRELNNILNERLKNGKITFIYAVKDELFSDKNRTKFFDFIIPIIPVLNASNSEGYLGKKLEYDFADNEKTFLSEIFKYVTDMRLGINICNEYKIYRKKFPKDKFLSINLLSIIMFKNIYPKDFSEANFNKGFLYELFFIKKKKLIERIIVNEKEELEIILENKNKLIKKSREQKIKNKDNLDKIFENEAYSIIFKKYQSVRNITTTKKESFLQLNFEYIRDNYGYWYPVEETFSYKELEEKIGIDYTREIDLISNFCVNDINLLDIEIKEKQDKLNSINYYSLENLIKILSEEQKEELLEQEIDNYKYNLKLFLFSNGYINEFYRDYLSEFKEGELTIEDNTFIRDIHLNKKNNELYQKVIRNPKVVLKKLKTVSKYNMLNINLIDYILGEKIDEFNKIKFLKIIDKNFENFRKEFIFYLKSLREKRKFILNLINKRANLWEEIIHFYSKEEIKIILEYFIINLSLKDFEMFNNSTQNKVVEYIENEDILTFSVDKNKLNDIFENIKFNIKKISRSGNEEIYKLIKKYKNFIVTKENIENIYFWEFNSELNNNRYYSEAKKLFFIDKIEENLELFLRNIYFNLSDFSEENECELIDLFENKIKDNKLKDEFLKLNINKFIDLKNFSNENWDLLFLNNKINSSLSNLNLYFEEKELTDILIEYIYENEKQIKKDIIGNKNLIDTFLEDERISPEIIDIILDNEYIYENKEYEKIEKEKMELLLGKNKIIFNNSLLKYLQENKISEEEFKQFLLIHEDKVKDLIEDENTRNLLDKKYIEYLILNGNLAKTSINLLNILDIEKLSFNAMIKILENLEALKWKRNNIISIEAIDEDMIEVLIKKNKIDYYINDLEFIFSLRDEIILKYIDVYMDNILLDLLNINWNVKVPEKILLKYINDNQNINVDIFENQIEFYKENIFNFLKLINRNFNKTYIYLDSSIWGAIVNKLEFFKLVKEHKSKNGKIVISIIKKNFSPQIKDYLL